MVERLGSDPRQLFDVAIRPRSVEVVAREP
jgi:hypothetical protein